MNLPDFELEVYFETHKAGTSHNLGSSHPHAMKLPELLALATDEQRERFETMSFSAVPAIGHEPLRVAIAKLYGTLTAEQILCFAGAEEGLFTAMQCLLAAQDHCIVITPNYQAAETVPASICAVTAVPLDSDRDWALDLDRLHDSLRPNTRLVSINFPHNPTGKLITRDELSAIVELCAARGIYLFSDEVYRLLEFDPGKRLPAVADLYDRGLSLNVTSKAYAMPGLRAGWIASKDRAALDRMHRYKHYLSICSSTPGEFLAEIAISNTDRIVAQNLALVLRNLALVARFIAAHGDVLSWRPPDAGCIAFPRYSGPEGAEAMVRQAREDAGIFMLPPSVFRTSFGVTHLDRFRIGFGQRDAGESLHALTDFLLRRKAAGGLGS